MTTRNVVLSGVLLACLVVLSGPAHGDEKTGKTYATPQAVFDAAVAAAKKKDWKAFHGCLSKESGDVVAGQMAFLGLMLKGFSSLDKTGKAAEKLKPLDEIYDKHGLTKEVLEKMRKEGTKPSKDPKETVKAMQQLAKPIKDKGAFFADVIKAMEEANPKKEANPFEGAELRGVKIDGDRATGTVIGKNAGKEKKDEWKFVKEDGGWKMEMPQPKPMPKAEDKP